MNGERRAAAAAFLAVITVTAVAVLGFLGFLVVTSFGTGDTGPGTEPAAGGSTPAAGAQPKPGEVSQEAREDELAAAPMLTLPQSASQPQPVVVATAGPPIGVPAPAVPVTPGGPPFATGFPHTPEGALGQLAAIDEAAMSTIDPNRVREVYAAAAVAGAVDVADWTPMVGVKDIIKHLGGADAAASAQVTYRVVMGQIKGTVGPDFVVACVLGHGVITAANVGRAGVGDCQRMVWVNGQWRIGPRAQPAPAPSAWPGSADSVRAGWRVVSRES